MINKLEYGIELVQGEIKVRYEYEQHDILFVETPDEEGVEEFRKGKSYPEIIYEYAGDSDEVREFIMEITKYRCGEEIAVDRCSVCGDIICSKVDSIDLCDKHTKMFKDGKLFFENGVMMCKLEGIKHNGVVCTPDI